MTRTSLSRPGTSPAGFGFAAPGEESDAHFVGLEPGVYTMACFVTTPDGEFHVDLGMFAEFEVTAAS